MDENKTRPSDPLEEPVVASIHFYLCKHTYLIAFGVDDIQNIDTVGSIVNAIVYDKVLHRNSTNAVRPPRFVVHAFMALRHGCERSDLCAEHSDMGKCRIGSVQRNR